MRNLASAKRKYKDKILEVSGTVAVVPSTDANDNATISLSTAQSGNIVKCKFGPDQEKAISKLTPGQKVKVLGKCVDSGSGRPVLENCTLY